MLKLSLLTLGITSLIAQIVMTRELMVSFYGNEFFIGWILFSWFIWTAAGCLAVRIWAKRGAAGLQACGHLSLGLLLGLSIVLARASRNFFSVSAGQVPDLVSAMVTCFLLLAPLGLVLGAQFTLGLECWKKLPQSRPASVGGQAYFWEALGFVLGGMAFNFVLIFWDEFRVDIFLGALNILAAVGLEPFIEDKRLKKGLLWASCALLFLGLAALKETAALNMLTAGLRFPNQELLETVNSVHGNLAVTRTNGQFNFYQNGLASGTSRQEALNETIVHLPMLSHPAPRNVLLIGGGLNGALGEILKHDPSRVYYTEINPEMIPLAARYVSAQGMHDRRVVLLTGDARSYLHQLPRDFDVILINLPNPSTAMINRYFTDEFIQEARGHLRSGGILSTHLAFSADYVSPPLEDLGACIYKTIKGRFAHVAVLPEETLLFLASDTPLPVDPQVLIERMKLRGLQTYFVTAPYLRYRFLTDRIGKVTAAFKGNPAGVNSDMKPRAYFHNLVYWSSIFHQGLSTALRGVQAVGFPWIVALFLMALALPLVVLGKPRPLMAAMSVGGLSLMSAEMLIIYGFQVFYGNLYYKIALIISAIMLGMAVGCYLGNKQKSFGQRQVGLLHLLMAGCFVLWLVLFRMAAVHHLPAGQGAWIFMASWVGVLVGWEFSYLALLSAAGGLSASAIYAADLGGSCAGVLLTSFFLLPVYGVYETLLLLAIVNAAVFLGLMRKGTL